VRRKKKKGRRKKQEYDGCTQDGGLLLTQSF